MICSMPSLVVFSCCSNKMLDTEQIKRGEVYFPLMAFRYSPSCHGEGGMVTRAAGHVAPTVSFLSPFYSVRNSSPWDIAVHQVTPLFS